MDKVYFEIVEEETIDRIKTQIKDTINENDRISEIWQDFAKKCGSPKPYLQRRRLLSQGIRLLGIYFPEEPTGWQRVSENFYKPTYTYQRKLRQEFVRLPEKKYVNNSFLPEYNNATHCQATRLWFAFYDFVGDRYFLMFVNDDDYYPQMQKDKRLKEIKEWEYLKIVDEYKEESSDV